MSFFWVCAKCVLWHNSDILISHLSYWVIGWGFRAYLWSLLLNEVVPDSCLFFKNHDLVPYLAGPSCTSFIPDHDCRHVTFVKFESKRVKVASVFCRLWTWYLPVLTRNPWHGRWPVRDVRSCFTSQSFVNQLCWIIFIPLLHKI